MDNTIFSTICQIYYRGHLSYAKTPSRAFLLIRALRKMALMYVPGSKGHYANFERTIVPFYRSTTLWTILRERLNLRKWPTWMFFIFIFYFRQMSTAFMSRCLRSFFRHVPGWTLGKTTSNTMNFSILICAVFPLLRSRFPITNANWNKNCAYKKNRKSSHSKFNWLDCFRRSEHLTSKLWA